MVRLEDDRDGWRMQGGTPKKLDEYTKPTRNNPITGKPYGKPGERIRDRLARVDTQRADAFDRPFGLTYYFAVLVESPSCWPRVLNNTMTQDRFHERTKRMMEAMYKAFDIPPHIRYDNK